MSEEFLKKIKYLCNKIANVEWSGPLFYSVKGDISEPATFEINLEDILPLDMGTKGYTEYDLDNRFIDYLMDKPERMDWNVGHIHSHNTFEVFFSGTDMAELNDNCGGHNFYLSLIVNNALDFTAKIAFSATADKNIEDVPYYALDNNGKQYVIGTKNFVIKKEKMYTYDCAILSPKREIITVDDYFANNVAEIMKPKPVYNTPSITHNDTKNYSNQWGEMKDGVWTAKKANDKPPVSIPSSINNNLEQTKLANKIKHFKLNENKLSPRAKKVKDLIKKLPFEDFEDLTDMYDQTPIDKFIIELVKFTTPQDPDEDLEDALTQLVELDLDAYTIASSIMENYTFLYDKHFPDSTDEEFLNDSEAVVNILSDEVAAYPIINVSIEAIKAMIKEFEENGAAV